LFSSLSAGFEACRAASASTPNALLLPIAEALAHLVRSEDFPLVKGCEGRTCTFLFLDRTHGRARRWCSMTICGNRAKQAAHRQRSAKKRKSPSKSPKRIAD
jgi:predicted RNA-binding Zn ribbon-like protein